MSIEPGQKLLHYELVEQIGEGEGCAPLREARFLCIQSEERPESDNWFQFVLNFDEVLRVKVPK